MTRNVRTTVLTLSLFAAMAAPAAAGPVEDCYNSVLDRCAAAMEDANYVERFALGVICSGMLAGCTGRIVTQ